MADKRVPFNDAMAHPRITFHASGRTFDRLLKESSLPDLKEAVRKKLGIGSGSVIQLVQLRHGQLVDLEDEDDFDAFCAVVHEQGHATIQVVLTENSITEDSNVDVKESKLPNLTDPSGSMSTARPIPPTPASALPSIWPLNTNSSTSDPRTAVPRKKVVLKNEDGIETKLETHMINVSSASPPSVALPSRFSLVRPLEDFSTVTYPEGIRSPEPELNIGAKGGKFRYDRAFLMQFMSICKEKPNFLISLDAFGLEPLRPLSLAYGPGDRLVSMTSTDIPFYKPLQQGPANQDVDPMLSHRTRSKRGEKRSEAVTATIGLQTPNIEPVVPLQMTENRWDKRSYDNNNDPDSPEVVDKEIKVLLDKLTTEGYDSISDEIIRWANRSENQKDGRILIQVFRLVFEKAVNEATCWSGMYARLCKKMIEQISSKVQDEGIRNSKGMPITGGQLFHKYLLNRCQEEFERDRFAKEATKAAQDQAVKATNENTDSGEINVDFGGQKAKRQGLGLIKFMGELFKRQMLTERVMHECIKMLIGDVQNPAEEDIESLCTLLTTIGSLLDTRKARAHLDVYFQRMQELSKNVSPRMQFMLQDVIELRSRKWQARNVVAAPTTIAQVHEAAVKAKVDTEKEDIQRLSVLFDGSRRGDHPQTDGWSSVSTRAGDLSQFGRIIKTQSATTFGPGSVFAGKDLKRESLSRTSLNFNMFSALQEAQQDLKQEQPTQRKKLALQPRTKPVEEPTPPEESITPSSEEASLVSTLTNEAADVKISEDVKEFFSIRNLDEAEVYFTALPSYYHHRLVHKLVSSAVESKESDAVLVADLFTRANSKGLCSSDAFEEGLTPTAEIIEDIAIDAPKAWTLFATMVKGAQSTENRRTRLASKSADSDKLLGLLSDVIELRERRWQARNAVVAPTAVT